MMRNKASLSSSSSIEERLHLPSHRYVPCKCKCLLSRSILRFYCMEQCEPVSYKRLGTACIDNPSLGGNMGKDSESINHAVQFHLIQASTHPRIHASNHPSIKTGKLWSHGDRFWVWRDVADLQLQTVLWRWYDTWGWSGLAGVGMALPITYCIVHLIGDCGGCSRLEWTSSWS